MTVMMEKVMMILLYQNANLTYPILIVYTPGPGFDVMKFNS